MKEVYPYEKISRRNFLLASGAVTIGAALAACGGSSASTSTASSAPASSAAPAAQGKVLNIWCWNDEFQSRFNDYYPEVPRSQPTSPPPP